MTDAFDYAEDMSEEPMPSDDAVDESKSDLVAPAGLFKEAQPTEQDELDELDEDYRDPDPED